MNRTDSWEEKYNLLINYYKKHGNIDVPESYVVGKYRLGTWLSSLRNAYKGQSSTTITEEQILKLIELDIDWNTRETKKLNNEIKDMKVYNKALNNRVNYVLNDMKFEGYNVITSTNQNEIEKLLIKRIWR